MPSRPAATPFVASELVGASAAEVVRRVFTAATVLATAAAGELLGAVI